MPTSRPLPPKVIIGYATDCNERVIQAIREGVNVVVWSFLNLKKEENLESSKEDSTDAATGNTIMETASLDLDCIRQMIQKLDEEGYNDTIHLVSFGGWNGPHLEETFGSAKEWYEAWKYHVGDLFHGIDWDLEGHDNLESPTNTFSVNCLERMGQISLLAKQDGYIIGMAPPQSYLDLESSNFSRSVNLLEPNRPWHNEFHYFGANVYAYLLAKYGDSIDFVSLQFYESYSRAAMAMHHFQIPPDEYLIKYVEDLVEKEQHNSYWVNFDQDNQLNVSSQAVSFPLSKLVFGFANGWALDLDDKVAFFEPKHIASAYRQLESSKKTPRGFMFWVIGEEGSHGIHYARALNGILSIRSQSATKTFKSSHNTVHAEL